MIKEFKEFIAKGNVVDLAVAVVIGTAFTLVVRSFTDDILGGVLGLLGGKPNFSDLTLTIRDSQIRYGAFLTAILNFVLIAFVLFLFVKAINRLQRLRPTEEEKAVADVTEIDLLTEIRDALVAISVSGSGTGTLSRSVNAEQPAATSARSAEGRAGGGDGRPR